MDYLYAPKEDFSFLASGNVIKHFSGMPCFPVRLTLELFERAYRLIGKDKISLYDPCCGNGFSITVLGLMCSDKLAALSGSDISPACVNAARCNASRLFRAICCLRAMHCSAKKPPAKNGAISCRNPSISFCGAPERPSCRQISFSTIFFPPRPNSCAARLTSFLPIFLTAA